MELKVALSSGGKNQEAIGKQTTRLVDSYVILYVGARVRVLLPPSWDPKRIVQIECFLVMVMVWSEPFIGLTPRARCLRH